MSRSRTGLVWAWVVALVLSACGGGSSAPDTPANQAPTANAGAAQTVLAGAAVQLDGTASSDPEGAALSYTWSITSAPAGSAVRATPLVGATTAHPSFVPDVAGSYGVSLVVSDGQLSSAAAAVTVTAQDTSGLAITLDKAEPVSTTVQLALSAAVAGAPVSWYVDLALVGTGASLNWNTSAVANGAHQVLARVQLAANNVLEIRRSVTVANSAVTLSATVSGVTGTIAVDLRAASPYGIVGVSGVFDGNTIGTLTAPNACSRYCGGTNDVYRFSIDAARAGSGDHTLVATAVDRHGDSRQVTVLVPISNNPVVNLVSPADGAFVYGTLQVAGSFSTDKPGGASVVASLGDVPILSTSAASFSGSYSLVGVAAGSYTLTLRVTDSSGSVTTVQRALVVTSSAALVYTPVMTLGAAGKLLAAEGDQVLYMAEDQSVRLRDLGAGTEVTLQGGTVTYANDWQISGGRVVVFGQGSDCTATFVCVYQWDASGARRNLSAGAAWSSSYQEHPVARDGAVVWSNGSAGYTLYDVAAGSYTRIAPAAGVNYVGNWRFDLARVNGALNVFYWGQTGSSATSSTYDVFRWQADTGGTTRLSVPGQRSVYVASDGAWAAWEQSAAGSSADGTELVSMTLASGVRTLQSSTMSSFVLRDGVLAWLEVSSSGRAVKAATTIATRTLSMLDTAQLYGTGGATVAFGEAGKVYTWNAALDRSTLRVEASPGQVLLAGGRLYFLMGATQSLYALRVD